eukprot:2494345-Pleurochrysis_carterae.AAC.1
MLRGTSHPSRCMRNLVEEEIRGNARHRLDLSPRRRSRQGASRRSRKRTALATERSTLLKAAGCAAPLDGTPSAVKRGRAYKCVESARKCSIGSRERARLRKSHIKSAPQGPPARH